MQNHTSNVSNHLQCVAPGGGGFTGCCFGLELLAMMGKSSPTVNVAIGSGCESIRDTGGMAGIDATGINSFSGISLIGELTMRGGDKERGGAIMAGWTVAIGGLTRACCFTCSAITGPGKVRISSKERSWRVIGTKTWK